MKYPIGIQSFEKLREDGYVYVDKTALIYDLVTTGTVYFLSCPRRFGKSLLLDTIECYFRGRKELFRGLAIDSLEKDWHVHPVFKVDFNGDRFDMAGVLAAKIEGYISRWEEIYGKNPTELTMGDRFMGVLHRASEQYGRRAVVLVDEYDKPLLDALDTPQEDENRSILKAFYSTFKSADRYTQFVFLTGVTKFSQVSVFSGFNQPDDISMSVHYDALCGITEEELGDYFAEPIARLAKEYDCTVEEMRLMLKRWYNGYHFSRALTDVYNPFSLINVFKDSWLDDYWFRSGTPTYLQVLLAHDHESINDLTGKYYLPKHFVDYRADVEKPLPMTYQSGYLTIKDYDRESNEFLLDFPNDEVRSGFLSVLALGYLNSKTEDADAWLSSGIKLLKKGETAAFRDSLTAFLAGIPYDTHPSLKSAEAMEKHFQYTFYLLLRLLGGSGCTLLTERTQAVGRVDAVLEFKDYIYIFEFKLDGSASDALRQIEEKRYAAPYQDDPRRLFLIGVNFSSETMTVKEWEEVSGRK
ncbi:MAG: ATP-binding protein [Phocaeicola sp.]|nr:ATP-binding protein [Phocaeicola sp.]